MSKKMVIGVAIVFFLAAGVILYLKSRKSADFEPLIKAKLQELVKDGSNGLYSLQMDKIQVDVLKSSIIAVNAKLLIDSSRLDVLDKSQQAPNDLFKIYCKALIINGVGVKDLLKKNSLDLEKI